MRPRVLTFYKIVDFYRCVACGSVMSATKINILAPSRVLQKFRNPFLQAGGRRGEGETATRRQAIILQANYSKRRPCPGNFAWRGGRGRDERAQPLFSSPSPSASPNRKMCARFLHSHATQQGKGGRLRHGNKCTIQIQTYDHQTFREEGTLETSSSLLHPLSAK